jgi:hypothetical protein
MALLMCDLLVEAGVIGAGDVSAQKLSAIVAKATSWRHHPQLTTKARRNPDRQSGHSRCAKARFPGFPNKLGIGRASVYRILEAATAK